MTQNNRSLLNYFWIFQILSDFAIHFRGGAVIRQVRSVKKPWGRLQHLLHLKKLDTICLLFYFCHHCFHVQEQPCTGWFFMHSNIQFSDKSEHVPQLSLIKDAAYISISHVLHLSVDHKRISRRVQLQLWCRHSEGFGNGCAILWDRWDETHRTGSSQARGTFQCSLAHFTNFTFWMAWQIGYGNGPQCLFF